MASGKKEPTAQDNCKKEDVRSAFERIYQVPGILQVPKSKIKTRKKSKNESWRRPGGNARAAMFTTKEGSYEYEYV